MAKTITVEIQSDIEIPEVPEGKKLVFKDGKFVVEPILPETWEEFCKFYRIKENEYYIESNSTITSAACSFRSSGSDRNILPSEEAAKAHIAYMQLHQLRDCYRQGWTPNWNNYNHKFCIELENGTYIISAFYKTSHFLSFPTKEIAEKFLKCFRSFIVQAGDLI